MQKIKFTLPALPLAVVILSGCTNVREIGCVNGTHLTRVTTRGIFSPSSTTILAHDTNSPGVEVLANASGPGFIPSVATAGGVVGGAALLRPSRTSVVNSSGSKATSDNNGDVSATSVNDVPINVAVPPANGHPNSPGNGGQPGNGGANNPNN